MDTDQLKAIGELKGYEFFVPSYQRGYRWGEREVKALLEDVWDFQDKGQSKAEFYCLQPLAVQKTGEKTYILIDGQQRLTTIFLIIKFIQNQNFFKIKYETREKSFDFLSDIKVKFSSSESQSNMDFYHFSKAYEYVENFFKEECKGDEEKNLFLETLLNRCKVLWYEIDQNEKANDVFIRLNIGKIPLVEAENIKALFLSKNDELDQDDLKERAEFWYQTEIEARKTRDFRYCVLSKVDEKDMVKDEQGRPVIKDDILRIEAYLRAITPPKKEIFDFFYDSYRNGGLNDLWEELEQAIDTLSGFASDQGVDKIDREIFHYLGFLILNGAELHEIYKKWREGENKNKFSEFLFNKVRRKVSDYLSKMENEELSYRENKDVDALKSLLLLFNLEYLIEHGSLDYFKFNRFVLEDWSLEHIYAQNSKSLSRSKESEKIKWLEEVLQYIDDETLEKKIKEVLELQEGEKIEDEKLKELYENIDKNFETNNDLHKISNLTLLDKSSNSRIGNQIFSKKKEAIMKLEQGHKLIPIATAMVFKKSFSENIGSPDFFTKKDREDYFNTICEYLKRYKLEEKSK